MKKRFIQAAAAITLTALLGGCYPSERKDAPNNISSESSNQDIAMPVLPLPDNIDSDIKIPENTKNEIASVTLRLKTWNGEEIKKMFFDGKELTYENESDEVFFPGEKFYCWETNDITVAVEPGRFYYADKSELGGKSQYGTVVQFSFDDNSLTDDCYASDEELAAFSREDAKKRVNEMLEKLGITNLGEPRIISFRAELANKILPMFKEWMDKFEDPFEYVPWTEDDEVYILRYSQIYENTELASMSVNYPYPGNDGSSTRDPGIVAIVSKDKILQLHAMTICEENYSTGESFPVNYTADQAWEKLKEYLSNLVLNESIRKYYGCKLVYIPYIGTEDNMTVSFKPAWEFAGYNTWALPDDDVDDVDFYYYVHRTQTNEYIWADTGHRYTPAT